MKSALFCIAALGSAGILPVTAQAQPGDEWITVRGDETPGIRYHEAITTSSGRVIGINGGALMISDDGGASWRFDYIEIDGVPLSGSITDLYQAPGGSLTAVMVRLEEASQGFFKYQARSYFVTSGNHGNTWQMQPFPHTSARFRGNGRSYHGVMINGLHMGPGGQLLAYGTIAGTNFPGIVWQIGGLVFRQSAQGQWEQSMYEYGPIDKVADAGGRAVAAAFNAVVDSADGAGWNGYTFRNAQVTLNGQPMDPEIKDRLRILDVEVINGTYVGLGGTFVPLPGRNIDTNVFKRIFKLGSPTPFSRARNWNAFEESRYHGQFTKAGNRIIAAGAGGVYYTETGNAGYTLGGADVRASGGAIAVDSGSNVYAVQTSETVWKSTSNGSSWTKVWDKAAGPSFRIIGIADGILYANADNVQLWLSHDYGRNWIRQETGVQIGSTLVRAGNDRFITPRGRDVHISDDRGVTWRTVRIEGTNNGGFLLQHSRTGRLIIPSRGADVRNEGKFFISDDNGETWHPRTAGHAFGEEIRAITQTKGGRLLVAANSTSVFNPKLYLSDDDGDTWTSGNPLAELEGLDTVTGDPSQKVFEWDKLVTSSTGRILAMSEDVIIYSDDEGDTWQLSENFDFNGTGPLDFFTMFDLIQVGSRWVASGYYRTPFPQSRNRHFFLISEDDGATWGLRPFKTNQSGSFIYSLGATDDGRLIATGGNASVFVSEFDPPMPPFTEPQTIREAGMQSVNIDRPDVDGVVEADYITVEGTAKATTDFVSLEGMLRWEADDMAAKTLMVQTVDNSTIDGERSFSVQLAFETSEDLLGQIDIAVSIEDNDSGTLAGLVFEGVGDLYTTEQGGTAQLGVSLEAKPTSDVTLVITGMDATEGQLSTDTLIFTAENFGIPQHVTIMGVDDPDPDGNVSYSLLLTPFSSDQRYGALGATAISITNRGDEPLPGGNTNPPAGYSAWVIEKEIPEGLDGPLDDPNGDGVVNLLAYAFDLPPIGSVTGSAITISNERTLTFTAPVNRTDVIFESQISSSLADGGWSPGPSPEAGPAVGGKVTYTVTLPPNGGALFARITARFVP